MLRERHKQNYTAKDEQTKRLYGIWHNMNQRCYNPRNMLYPRYGERGITVCDLWRNTNPYGFACFVSWAWQNGYNDTLTIDRIDNNGNYEPSNCQWADMKEQTNNRGDFNVRITIGDRTQTLMQWCEEYSIDRKDYSQIRSRIMQFGWNAEEALKTPISRTANAWRRHPVTVNGIEYTSIVQAYEAIKPPLSLKTVQHRIIKQGMSADEAFTKPSRKKGER